MRTIPKCGTRSSKSRCGRASSIDQCNDGRGVSADYRDSFDLSLRYVDRALNDGAHD